VTNSGTPADVNGDILPVYKQAIVNGAAVNVCSTTAFDPGETGNKLGIIQYVRFTVTAMGTVSYSATATVIPAGETTDPDMWVWQPPSPFFVEILESADADSESTKVIDNVLQPGDYLMEVFEFSNRRGGKIVSGDPPADAAIGRACFDVTITQP
jgi:hypothetical protein